MKADIKKLLPGIRENVSLKNYTTFKIGGRAKYFFIAKSKQELISAILLAKKLKLPFFILGNGSNLLISDKGFKGIVIKLQVARYKIQENLIFAEAGISLGQLVIIALKNNLTGLEWAVGIPGTLGGAIFGNAGAFGKSIGDNVKNIEVYNIKNKKIKILKYSDCKFSYRDSIFKKNKNLIIISVIIKLRKGNKKEIKNKIKEYLDYRKKHQPLNFSSIGSIFKNPKAFSAGYLIEKSDLKGKKIGNIKISEKHGNFIVNLGKGKAKDVKKLINLIKRRVKKFFGVNLEEEIQYLGF